MSDKSMEESVPEKSNKKLFIIIGAAVAVVIVVAVAVLLVTGRKGDGGKGKEATADAKQEKVSVPSVVSLDPFIVNIYDGAELRYLKIKIEFGTSGPNAKAQVEAQQAPIRDAILILLTTKTLQDIRDLQGKNQLRQDILTAVNKIVPAGAVTQVYFTDFVVQ